jgi:hypothetical protein
MKISGKINLPWESPNSVVFTKGFIKPRTYFLNLYFHNSFPKKLKFLNPVFLKSKNPSFQGLQK